MYLDRRRLGQFRSTVGRAALAHSAVRAQDEILYYHFTGSAVDHRGVGPAVLVHGAIPVARPG